MKLEDVKIGMKVKLLGKHGLIDNYNNIEDWFKDTEAWDSVKQIKEQGFGIVVDIFVDDEILVDDGISTEAWYFLSSDLEPYDEKEVINKK